MRALFQLPSLFVRLMASQDVPWQSKALMLAGVAYVVSPIDVAPDIIPVLGWLEDAGVMLLILDGVLNHLPADVLHRNWQGDRAGLVRLQSTIARFARVIPRPLRWWVMKRAFSGARRPLAAKAANWRPGFPR